MSIICNCSPTHFQFKNTDVQKSYGKKVKPPDKMFLYGIFLSLGYKRKSTSKLRLLIKNKFTVKVDLEGGDESLLNLKENVQPHDAHPSQSINY